MEVPELLPVVLELLPVVSVEAAASVPLWCLPEPKVPELPVPDWSLCGMLELELAPVEGVVEPALAPVDPELL